jgi:hypothetical protein
MARPRSRSPAAIGCGLVGQHVGPTLIGRAGSRVGLAACVAGREVACLTIGSCGHTGRTVAAVSSQITRVSTRRTSSLRVTTLAVVD